MEHYYQNEDCTIYNGDCLQLMKELAADSIDSIVTDPPYGLKFMGKEWDSFSEGDIAMRRNPQMDAVNTGASKQGGRQRACADYQKRQARDMRAFQDAMSDIFTEALRVAKPGAHLLAFGGSRTYHRLAVAVEDAGWEIRDCIMWVYGSGFPKSLDVSKAIDKAAGVEREFTPIGNPVKRMIPGADQGKSGSWIKDNGREFQPGWSVPATDAARQWEGFGTSLKPAYEPILVARKPTIGTVAANVLKHGTGGINIDGCRIGTDDTRQLKRGGKNDFPNEDDSWEPKSIVAGSACGRWPANVIHDGSDEVLRLFPNTKSGSLTPEMNVKPSSGWAGGSRADRVKSSFDANKGSAARFFYCSKATRQERRNSKHPTIKPLALMQYLVRLVTPPGGTTLDPFMGSGSTIEAAWAEGMQAIGMDLSAEYCEDAANRARAGIELFGKRK